MEISQDVQSVIDAGIKPDQAVVKRVIVPEGPQTLFTKVTVVCVNAKGEEVFFNASCFNFDLRPISELTKCGS